MAPVPSRPRSLLTVAILLVAAVALVFCVGERSARADLKLDGRWKQSPLREDFTVQQWLDAGCGPHPQSTTTGGGEIISIRLEGDELAFVGGGRVYRTNACYDPMPTLSRESHSRDASGKTWRTRCTTAPADPRKTVLNTLVVATTDTHIDLIETGRYEITLENGRCMADVKRTRSFDLVEGDNNTTPTATATTPPTPTPTRDPEPKPNACASPGEPNKLEVRPSKKLLRTGEAFKFRALVLDAKGCDTRTATTWKLAPEAEGKGVTVDGAGNVTVTKEAPEGAVEIVATAAGKDARVTVEVTSPARYDELLARSGLNSAGENDEASTATIASQSLGAGEGRVEDRARERRLIFLAIVGGVLVILAISAILLFRRSKRAQALLEQADERHEARVQQVLDRRRRREEEHAAQLRAHEESVRAAKNAEALEAAEGAAPQPGARPATAGKTLLMQQSPMMPTRSPSEMVCASCGRESPPGTTYCPHDGSALVPAASKGAIPYPAPAAMAAKASTRGKICPTCGERFDGGADFCGKDGTQLVLLN